jgi:hypothetical protein
VKFSEGASEKFLANNCFIEKAQFRSFIGAVNYLSANTRPDLTWVVSYLSRNLEAPSECDLLVASRVLMYIAGTSGQTLDFRKGQGPAAGKLVGFSDASWVAPLSQAGSCIFAGESLIFWRSYRIKSVCLSSCEAEFVACSDLGRELVYVANFQREISAKIVESEEKKKRFEGADRRIFWNHPEKRLLCDNQGAIFAAHNSEQKRLKHIDIRYFWLRQQVQSRALTLRYVPTAQQVADCLTKAPANAEQLERFKGWLFHFSPGDWAFGTRDRDPGAK